MTQAKNSILEKIRNANKATQASVPKYKAPRPLHTIDQSDRLSLFRDRLQHYGVRVQQCSATTLQTYLRKRLEELSYTQVVCPDALYPELQQLKTQLIRDSQLNYKTLDQVDGVITACAVAIAETGTIVLNSKANQGRRALSLVPDWHACIVRAEQVVTHVVEGMSSIENDVKEGWPITFISGPSATADIAFHRVQGVHGPRRFEVFLVDH